MPELLKGNKKQLSGEGVKMNLVTKLIRGVTGRLLNEESRVRLISYLAYATETNLLSAAHSAMGVGNWGNVKVSGEDLFVRDMLPCLLNSSSESPLILFDVGANKGEYCGLLRDCFPKARIYAFEPNRKAFTVLEEKCAKAKIQMLNFGFSSHDETAMLSVPQSNLSSSHGTLHSDVYQVIHHSKEKTVFEEVKLRTVSGFAQEAGIHTIDFLKIDTEGHELAVLKGCRELLTNGSIKVVQFEFNQMNVISRVFLRDFHELLDARYDLFRIASKVLVPLNPYNTRNEIFVFQNIVAVLKPLADESAFSRYIRR
jgi:FkbM family methyltransferase